MTFEEQLTQAFQTLTERLHGEIADHVQRTSAAIVAAAPYDRDPSVVEAARQELELAVAAARRESEEAASAAHQSSSEALAAARQELQDAVAAARQESQDAVVKAQQESLDAVAKAQQESQDAVAKARQESQEAVAAAQQESEAALAAARREADEALAVARQEAHEQGLAAGRDVGRAEALREAAEAPLPDSGIDRLADALRAIDSARSLSDMLDTLVTVARWDASSVDVWLLRGGQLHRWQATGAANDAATVQSLDAGGLVVEAARHNATTRDEHTLAVPIALAGEVVAVFSANRDREERVGPRTAILELLVGYAARSLEALTAFKTVRALTQPQEPSSVAAPQVVVDAAASEEETSARRYARLLVSEIKLYHEPAVVEGRRDRDLVSRLGGEIARARVMYEQRVPLDVRGRTDYFQDELVRTLANGDAGLLDVRSQKSEVRSEK